MTIQNVMKPLLILHLRRVVMITSHPVVIPTRQAAAAQFEVEQMIISVRLKFQDIQEAAVMRLPQHELRPLRHWKIVMQIDNRLIIDHQQEMTTSEMAHRASLLASMSRRLRLVMIDHQRQWYRIHGHQVLLILNFLLEWPRETFGLRSSSSSNNRTLATDGAEIIWMIIAVVVNIVLAVMTAAESQLNSSIHHAQISIWQEVLL